MAAKRLPRIIIGSPAYDEEVGVGDVVYDDLTRDFVRITVIEHDGIAAGVWVNHTYLEGARHPWEIQPIGPWRSI